MDPTTLENAPTGNIGAQVKSGKTVIEIIKMEHILAKDIHAEYQRASDPAVKEAKIQLLINQLVQHGEKEGIALYPVMRKKIDNGPALVDRAVQDHQELVQDLYNLDQMKYSDSPSKYEEAVEKMMSSLMKHMTEEETTLLPAFQSACSSQELIELGDKFESHIVTTRPHPWAPREGVLCSLANAASVPLDAARDAFRFTEKQKELARTDVVGDAAEGKGVSGKDVGVSGGEEKKELPKTV
jgi:hemerythrin superfamily protein